MTKVGNAKHGKWVPTIGAGGMCGTFVCWECSECGHEIIDEEDKTPYCPVCGARMDEVE